ncbi:MAG: class F sortase [Nocardioides sp.]
MTRNGWSLGRRGGLLLALAAVAAGLALVLVVILAQVSAPQPHDAGKIDPPSPATTSPKADQGSSAPTVTTPGKKPLGASEPVTIKIPSIGVDSPVHPIGLSSDGTLAVPQPGPYLNHAAWYEKSPTPGQPGPSIIEGHVDSTQGPSVFFKLGDLKPGNVIQVTRADGSMLTFKIDAVRDFLKSKFPTNLVYGGQTLDRPTLRLITCSDFDPSIRHHVGNEVVFASLTHVQRG